jgi:hypothetical protein
VNLRHQSADIERRLRDLQKIADELNERARRRLKKTELAEHEMVKIELTATAESHPLDTVKGHHLLKSAEYNFRVREPGGKVTTIGTVTIEVPPPKSNLNPVINVEGGPAEFWSL